MGEGLARIACRLDVRRRDSASNGYPSCTSSMLEQDIGTTGNTARNTVTD